VHTARHIVGYIEPKNRGHPSSIQVSSLISHHKTKDLDILIMFFIWVGIELLTRWAKNR